MQKIEFIKCETFAWFNTPTLVEENTIVSVHVEYITYINELPQI